MRIGQSKLSVSNDNPYSEALFSTVKHAPAYPTRPFADLAAARQRVARFMTWYNAEHRHGAIRFVTQLQQHTGQDVAVLAARDRVYAAAKAACPERRRGRATHKWQPVGSVWLNPDHPAEPAQETLRPAA